MPVEQQDRGASIAWSGGKEVIDEYLERTKLDVAESEKYLRQVLGYLKLEPLAPSKKP